MNSRPFIMTTIVLLAATGPAFGDDAAAAKAPDCFAQLLKVGESVLLISSNDATLYTIQLLSREQAVELRAKRAEYLNLEERFAGVQTQLGSEKGLAERAALYLQAKMLNEEISSFSYSNRLAGLAYEVAHVGQDFVTLTKPDKEKSVPLRSIREMNRSESLDSVLPARPSRGRLGAFDQLTNIEYRLEHTSVADVAKIVREFYPDPMIELQVNERTNTLVLTGNRDALSEIGGLIKTLDAVPKAKSPTKQPQR